jgi:hypothetical protein
MNNVVKSALQSNTHSDKIAGSSTIAVEDVLREQLKQWESVKRHASREIAKLEKRLAELK